MEVEGGAQSLGQTEGKGLRPGRIEVRRAGGRSLGGQSRIHMGRASLSRVLFEEVKMTRWSGRRTRELR